MRKPIIAVVAFLQLLPRGSAQEHEFFRWNTPEANLAARDIRGRQSPPPGYHPEFGSCGSGTTCENACGANWISCQASTSLSLFCYNKVDLNQTCCENGSGRACDNGYYCAWQEFGGKVWCCENGQNLEECGVPTVSSTSASLIPSSTASSGGSSPPASPTSGSLPSTTSSGSATPAESSSATSTHYPAFTVTDWATTTVLSTVTFGVVTVTAPAGEGCSSSVSSSCTTPASISSVSTTITQPPPPYFSSYRPPASNTTVTMPLVTGAAGSTRPYSYTFILAILGWLWV